MTGRRHMSKKRAVTSVISRAQSRMGLPLTRSFGIYIRITYARVHNFPLPIYASWGAYGFLCALLREGTASRHPFYVFRSVSVARRPSRHVLSQGARSSHQVKIRSMSLGSFFSFFLFFIINFLR